MNILYAFELIRKHSLRNIIKIFFLITLRQVISFFANPNECKCVTQSKKEIQPNWLGPYVFTFFLQVWSLQVSPHGQYPSQGTHECGTSMMVLCLNVSCSMNPSDRHDILSSTRVFIFVVTTMFVICVCMYGVTTTIKHT